MTDDEVDALVDRHNASLGEHFEAVQTLVTWSEGGFTYIAIRGVGNYYARQGMARRFLQLAQAQDNANEIKKVLPPPDDDGEGWNRREDPW